MVSRPETDSYRLLDTIRNYYNPLLPLCVEVLSDFDFLLRYPSKAEFLSELKVVCLENNILDELCSNTKPDKGQLAAWADILTYSKPTSAQLMDFKTAYLDWVVNTAVYSFQKRVDGRYTQHECEFFNHLCCLLPCDVLTLNSFQQLWKQKISIYYGWRLEEWQGENGWFQHIGLVLWGLSIRRYTEYQDVSFLISVIDQLNNFIPMALSNGEYDLLLFEIFDSPSKNIEETEEPLIHLARKILDLPMLYNIILWNTENLTYFPQLLVALTKQLKLLFELPIPQGQKVQDIATLISTLEMKIN